MNAPAVTDGPSTPAKPDSAGALVAAILPYVRRGVEPSVAARSLGLPAGTWESWVEWAALGNEECKRMVAECDRAAAQHRAALESKLSSMAVGGDVRAATALAALRAPAGSAGEADLLSRVEAMTDEELLDAVRTGTVG